jgi:hypothetical protein
MLLWSPSVARRGFSTGPATPRGGSFDLYCVIDQEQQSTGQFRAALRGGSHEDSNTHSQKIPNPNPQPQRRRRPVSAGASTTRRPVSLTRRDSNTQSPEKCSRRKWCENQGSAEPLNLILRRSCYPNMKKPHPVPSWQSHIQCHQTVFSAWTRVGPLCTWYPVISLA